MTKVCACGNTRFKLNQDVRGTSEMSVRQTKRGMVLSWGKERVKVDAREYPTLVCTKCGRIYLLELDGQSIKTIFETAINEGKIRQLESGIKDEECSQPERDPDYREAQRLLSQVRAAMSDLETIMEKHDVCLSEETDFYMAFGKRGILDEIADAVDNAFGVLVEE